MLHVLEEADGVEMRMLIAAASRVLRGEVAARTRLLATDADEAFAIGADGELIDRGQRAALADLINVLAARAGAEAAAVPDAAALAQAA